MNFKNFLQDGELTEITQRTYESIYKNYIEPVCEAKHKELHELDITTLQDLISSLPTSHSNSKQVMLTLIKTYFAYCESRGLVDYNVIDTFDAKSLTTVDEDRFKANYIGLKDFWYWIYNDCQLDDNSRLLLGMLRYGVSSNDLGTVKEMDLDRNNKTLYITNSNLALPVDTMFIRLFEAGIKAETMEINTAKDNDVRYAYSDYVIKPTDKAHSEGGLEVTSIYSRITYISQSIGSRVKIKNFNNSRLVDLLLETYRINGYVSIIDVNEVLIKLTGSTSNNKSFRLKQDFTKITGIEVLTVYKLAKLNK